MENATQENVVPPHWQLTEQQIEAATLLVKGDVEQKAIAEQLEVDRSTLWRWQQQPEFMRCMAELAEAKIEEGRNILRAHAAEAARRIVKGMKERGIQGLKAAVEIIKQTMGDPSQPQLTVQQGQGQVVLTDDDLRILAKAHGGPTDETED